jgi:Zn-dependent oligopeptidase
MSLFLVSSSSNTIGYFYLDLFPRNGKYGHAAVFPCINKSESTVPVAAMACNFAKDFMTFDELETFFHEFGHVMHHLSSKSMIGGTASFACEPDFVETPSQMFEEWCYTNKTLKIISPLITDDIIEKIKKQRNILQGYHYARQLSFCYLDMEVHSKKYNHNSFETNRRITKEILNLDVQDNTNSVASFGHLMGGYDAGYYGYLWSLVYAKDLFTKFIGHELDANIGKEFRDMVLSQGSIRKSMDSIKLFLGREPNENAFISDII